MNIIFFYFFLAKPAMRLSISQKVISKFNKTACNSNNSEKKATTDPLFGRKEHKYCFAFHVKRSLEIHFERRKCNKAIQRRNEIVYLECNEMKVKERW